MQLFFYFDLSLCTKNLTLDERDGGGMEKVRVIHSPLQDAFEHGVVVPTVEGGRPNQHLERERA